MNTIITMHKYKNGNLQAQVRIARNSPRFAKMYTQYQKKGYILVDDKLKVNEIK